MDHEQSLVGKFQPDDFEEIAGSIRPDTEHLGWITVRLEINNDQCPVKSMVDVISSDSVALGRCVDLDTHKLYYVLLGGCDRSPGSTPTAVSPILGM